MKKQEPQGPFCQSCGMPMADASTSDWGTNSDGSKNEEFCSYCYQNGSFTDPQETAAGMAMISAKGWSETDPGVSYNDALMVTKELIPTLKRWQ